MGPRAGDGDAQKPDAALFFLWKRCAVDGDQATQRDRASARRSDGVCRRIPRVDVLIRDACRTRPADEASASRCYFQRSLRGRFFRAR